MDPINIIVGLNIIASFGANLTGAKKGLKSTVTPVKERPKTYLPALVNGEVTGSVAINIAPNKSPPEKI